MIKAIKSDLDNWLLAALFLIVGLLAALLS